MAAERKFGGDVYRCDPLPAEQGLDLYLEMNEIFGGSDIMLGAILEPHNRQKLLAAFVNIAADLSLDKAKVGAFLKKTVELCSVVSRGSVDPCVMGVKPAEMSDAIEIMFFCLQVQFKDFLSASLPRGEPGQSLARSA